jgi:hypothetical protein
MGQEELTPQEADDFQGRISVGLGLAGFTSTTEFVMADQHGVTYDVMSLLKNRSARERIGVSEEYYAELSDLQTELKTKMDSMTVSAAYVEEERDKLKALFLKTEAELRQSLNAEQFSMLKFERARNGIKMVGLTYLADPEVASSLGITVETAKLIGKLRNSHRQQMKTLELRFLKEANEKLIKSLSESQLEKVGNLLDKETRRQFLKADLFANGKDSRRQSKPWSKKYLSSIGLKSVQRKLGLSQGQLEQVGQLDEQDPELEKSIADILTQEQLLKLDQRGIRAGAKKLGTVNLMTDGFLGQRLALSDEEKDRLFDFGKELNVELARQLEQASEGWAVKVLGSSEDQAQKMTAVLRLFGE